jgi:hypothetical protein
MDGERCQLITSKLPSNFTPVLLSGNSPTY